MNESSNYKTPNRRSNQNVLQPSLRSKAIHYSTNLKRKNEPRKLLRHESVEEKSLGLYRNTLSSFPSFGTPPSAQKKTVVINPFNIGLRERLEGSTVSPNVFSTVVSPSQCSEEVRWTIEDLSTMKPAPIEENVEPLSEPDDPQVQEAIDKYFSEIHMVPSPFDAPKNWVSRNSTGTPIFPKLSDRAVASTPRGDSYRTVQTRDVLVQTALSLPPVLPEDVEAVLRPYFGKVDNGEMEESNLNASSMRRKLFFHKDDEQLSPVKCNNEIISQKTEDFSPAVNASEGRYFTPIAGSNQGEYHLNISPILMEKSSSTSMERSLSINVSKSRARLEFSDNCDNPFSKELADNQEKHVDIVIDANSLTDEPMMVSVIDVTKLHRIKKYRSASDGDVSKRFTSTLNMEKGSVSTSVVNPSTFEDLGYYTNEDMSWRQSLQVTKDKSIAVTSLPISFLPTSTPMKQQVDQIL